MAEGEDAWTTKANEALAISLVVPAANGVRDIAKFHPEFTYPIYGEQEEIYGYQGLKINLRFNASDMRPHFSFTSSSKVDEDTDVEPTDVKGAIEEFLPPVAFISKSEFLKSIARVPSDWSPPGERVAAFDSADSQYEIWCGNLDDPLMKAFVNRIQILVSLFIEAGTPLRLESSEEIEADPLERWTVYLLFEKQKPKEGFTGSNYVFAGYSTVFRFYLFQPVDLTTRPAQLDDFDLPSSPSPFSAFTCRSRISQFIILPPFQRKGNGARLYDTIFKRLLENPQTIEITVEAPSEAFDLLRDLSDLEFLRAQPEFESLKLDRQLKLPSRGSVPQNILNKPALEALRKKTKIAPRQFYRLVEMQLMSKLPESVRPSIEPPEDQRAASSSDSHEYKLWRLVTKARLYVHNRDALGQMEGHERVDALHETLVGVELEYARILAKFESQKKAAGSIGLGKRRLDEAEAAPEQPVSKKQRLEKT